jgi:hypothetical protein
MSRYAIAAVLTAALACSGDSKGSSTGTTTSTGTGSATNSGTSDDPEWTVPVKPDDPPAIERPTEVPVTASPSREPNTPPELVPPAITKVGTKQTVSFGVVAIDHDLDVVRVDLVDKPASAKWDPLTLTVTWTPTRKDRPGADFTARITETRDGTSRTYDHSFHIEVVRKKVALPSAATQNDVVEALLTIHDPARLARANKQWPFDEMLLTSAELFRDALGPDAAANVGKLDKKQLYRDFVAGMHELHDNPRLDRASKSFDKAFAKASSWKIVSVRPRLDKKWQEIRVVYQNTRSAEPAFAMFRLRPTRTGGLPPSAREINNAAFSTLVWDAFFTAKGDLDPKLVSGTKAHGKAVAKLISDVISFKGGEPYQRGTFIALATGARLGGGSARDADGNYASGDGWAWSAQKPLATSDGSALVYQNIPIKGFWTATATSADGKSWVAKCAPRFDPDDDAHAAGYEVLCRKDSGLVDFPAIVDGKVVSGKKEAQNLYVDHKTDWSIANLALRDPRRDQGEEKGMTCSQCHTRNFGVRDYYDASTIDPGAGTPTAMNKSLATTAFVIVPTDRWSEYTLDFQKDQECRAKRAFSTYLKKNTSLSCPLAPN